MGLLSPNSQKVKIAKTDKALASSLLLKVKD
jgi:hypothetical protein